MDKKIYIDGVDVSIPVKLRPNRTDLTGKKFGKLTVIKPVISAKIGQKAHSRWLCQCECGNYKVAYTFSLTSGNTQSCGCLVHKPNTYVKRLKAEIEELKKQVKNNETAYQVELGTYNMECGNLLEENKTLIAENERLKANKGRCAFKSLDNTFCDEARIKIDKLELDRDCLNASLETARKYRGIAETDRDLYKQALQEIREIVTTCLEFYKCEKCKFYKECNCDTENYILAKINEVIGVE